MEYHHIKCWPIYYESLRSGIKNFEVRKDDRNYKEGDKLVIGEYDPEKCNYSGSYIIKEITYKLNGGNFGILPGYCVLGIK